MTQIFPYTAVEFEIHEELFEARWHGGSGVGIYRLGQEVDYFQNFSIRSEGEFLEAVKGYIVGIHEQNELDNSNEASQN